MSFTFLILLTEVFATPSRKNVRLTQGTYE